MLVKKGVKADLSLEENKIDNSFGVDYFLWLPTKDHRAPTPKQLLIGTNFIDQLVKNGIKVYVHCQNGHGRAPTLVAAYFIIKGMTTEEALSLIKKRRKSIHPNKHQKAALKSFENKINH
ncbi:dual specificity protein phosphatase family protein [Candidatus Pacearchaeota archaeon]|nr:dual specificity protein phosphatase family protein [Candidatus Pacearchaeota archaeon]